MRKFYLFSSLILCFFNLQATVSPLIKVPFSALENYKFFKIKNINLQPSITVDTLVYDCRNFYSNELILQQINEIEKFYNQLSNTQLQTTRKLFALHSSDIRKALRENELPVCFQLLPVVLSAMNKQYSSTRNTVGIWQLSYPVAVRYGLTLNAKTDERKDPTASSFAAAKYLRFLMNKYQNEELTLLAFLNSPADLNYALQQTTLPPTFENLYPFLPQNSRDLYLAYQVMNYKFVEFERRAWSSNFTENELHVDTLNLEKDLLTSVFMKFTRADSSEISFLNPTFVGIYIPKANLDYSLLVPAEVKKRFESIKDSIYKEQLKLLTPPKPKPITPPDNSKITFYTVKSGDVLGSIASRFGTSVAKLKYWNQLSSDRINVGQKLKVYVNEKEYPKYSTQTTTNATQQSGKIITYTVKQGDNLWKISQNYPSVSPEDIMEFNNIDENITIGQQIKIKVP